MSAPTCPYCGRPAELVHGSDVFPLRHALHHGQAYLCEPCDAYVGCHPGSTKPVGRLANAELRRMQTAAREVFNQVWQSGDKSRPGAFLWLAAKLGIPGAECHINLFDVETCLRVITICNERKAKKQRGAR